MNKTSNFIFNKTVHNASNSKTAKFNQQPVSRNASEASNENDYKDTKKSVRPHFEVLSQVKQMKADA